MRDDDIAARRRRLRVRSRCCGTKEASTVLGGFAEARIDALTPAQLARFEALLAEDDADLLDWILGRQAPPPRHDTDLFRLILQFRNGLSTL